MLYAKKSTSVTWQKKTFLLRCHQIWLGSSVSVLNLNINVNINVINLLIYPVDLLVESVRFYNKDLAILTKWAHIIEKTKKKRFENGHLKLPTQTLNPHLRQRWLEEFGGYHPAGCFWHQNGVESRWEVPPHWLRSEHEGERLSPTRHVWMWAGPSARLIDSCATVWGITGLIKFVLKHLTFVKVIQK